MELVRAAAQTLQSAPMRADVLQGLSIGLTVVLLIASGQRGDVETMSVPYTRLRFFNASANSFDLM